MAWVPTYAGPPLPPPLVQTCEQQNRIIAQSYLLSVPPTLLSPPCNLVIVFPQRMYQISGHGVISCLQAATGDTHLQWCENALGRGWHCAWVGSPLSCVSRYYLCT